MKFDLLVDLGTIVVPKDYAHETHLTSFGARNREKFYCYNGDINDVHFPNPSRILKPGDELRVSAFRQLTPGTTSTEDRMAFLATQNAVFTGAQGASLVFDQKRDQLPKGKWYASFDKMGGLWYDGNYHWVPCVYCALGGGFEFDCGMFEHGWNDDRYFFCFCDK